MSVATLEQRKALKVKIVADDAPYEIIDGQRVERPPVAILSIWIASQLHRILGNYADTHKLGRALCEAIFHLPDPVNRNRRPDVAFVSYERWGRGRVWPRAGNAWNVVPNLCIEVVSPTDGAEDLQEKVEDYFHAGVQLVVVYPLQSKVYAHSSLTSVQVFGINDQLTADSVLPGFHLALAELFAEPVEEAPPSNGDEPIR